MEVEEEVEEVNNFHATPPTTRTSLFVSECYCADVSGGRRGREGGRNLPRPRCPLNPFGPLRFLRSIVVRDFLDIG